MNVFKSIVIFLVLLLSASCSKEDPAPTPSPEPAVLVYPVNNESCEPGTIESDSRATVLFDWQRSENTSGYRIHIKNLTSGVEFSEAAPIDSREITLDRETSYSWYVVSHSNATEETAKSETWNFYLSGVGTENHVPFPANLISPEHEESVSGISVVLSWSGSDLDNDIKNYDVYLDESTDPITKVGDAITNSSFTATISSGKTYYWKVVTRDEVGNTATSNTQSFTVN
ncbi:hypothetical protein [Flavicella marina]|uniref:hypothetical protein n=1 Tax=Flavicella marina TaxID=1475951 RepID=UPI00126541CF|nr:hypothetical protein [Flavicella marina]